LSYKRPFFTCDSYIKIQEKMFYFKESFFFNPGKKRIKKKKNASCHQQNKFKQILSNKFSFSSLPSICLFASLRWTLDACLICFVNIQGQTNQIILLSTSKGIFLGDLCFRIQMYFNNQSKMCWESCLLCKFR
jgi:hypothetical protein